MRKRMFVYVCVLLLILTVTLSVFTSVSLAKDEEGDPDDYGCAAVLMNGGTSNQAIGKPVHKGGVEDLDFD
ncbi:MAG: hypothetical protein V1726_05555 [Methanobacteriota archaeon]